MRAPMPRQWPLRWRSASQESSSSMVSTVVLPSSFARVELAQCTEPTERRSTEAAVRSNRLSDSFGVLWASNRAYPRRTHMAEAPVQTEALKEAVQESAREAQAWKSPY